MEDLLNQLQALLYDANSLDDYWHTFGEYEWELGSEIVHALYPSPHFVHSITSKMTLFGIPVRVNMYDTQIIKLWREVK